MELTQHYDCADVPFVSTDNFVLRSKLLADCGIKDKGDQRAFFVSLGVGVGMFSCLSYKNHLLKQYIAAPDLAEKEIIKRRKLPFRNVELKNAQFYLNKYKRKPLLWLIGCPAVFLGYQMLKRGNPKFWDWNKNKV